MVNKEEEGWYGMDMGRAGKEGETRSFGEDRKNEEVRKRLGQGR